MIHVDRTALCPEKLATQGAKELARWEKYLAHGGKKPRFTAYALEEVREELRRMFNGKCAYCESSMLHVTPADVEHWRPKGKIRNDDGTLVDGYWWLAADWQNLFPACPNCNRATGHDAAGGGRTAGKGMRFPLAPPRAEAPKQGTELNERPLLLNPSDPDPAHSPEQPSPLPPSSRKPASCKPSKADPRKPTRPSTRMA